MEVFMSNLPNIKSDDGLQIQLEPFLKALDIVDYSCTKFGQNHAGLVSFLHQEDAEKFLARHGEVTVPRPVHSQPTGQRLSSEDAGDKLPEERARARLKLLGNYVYCKPNRKPIDPFALRAIQLDMEQRKRLEREHPKQRSEQVPDSPTKIQLQSASCGFTEYHNGGLAFEPQWTVHEPGVAKFTKRRLTVDLRHSRAQLRINYSTVVQLVYGQDSSFIITVSAPPTFMFPFSHLPSQSQIPDNLLIGLLNRQRDKKAPEYSRLTCIDATHAHVAPYALVYQFRAMDESFHELMRKVTKTGRFSSTRFDLALPKPRTFDPMTYHDHVRVLLNQLSEINRLGDLSFDILFQLQALAHNSYLNPVTVGALAGRMVQIQKKRKVANGSSISSDAMKKLFDIGYPSPGGDPRQLHVDGILEMLERAEKQVLDGGADLRASLQARNPNLTRCYRAMVTPTRITLHGPEMTTKNRVIRKFPNHHSYFMRVQFCDENGTDLYLNGRVDLEHIYERFRKVMKTGILVAGRKYDFLGFSHSSLRAHSLWFSAQFVYQGTLHSYRSIIEDLGDFSKIRSPARCAARIGQAFSETPFSVPLGDHGIDMYQIPDVTARGRVFSDGVGTISHGAMEAVWEHLPPSKQGATCFQIRLGGSKGMLCLDKSLAGNCVCIRPSMTKFPSKDIHNLEICDVAARPIPFVLNRPLIKILEDMGAPESWFMNLQNMELSRLRGVTAQPCNTASFLRVKLIGEGIRLSQFFRTIDALGIDYKMDPFLRSVVEAAVLSELRLLKHKARIPVHTGITLFGVMDETGWLKEGQVYLACDNVPGMRITAPGQGPVIVTRSPALHAGDVQLAVNMIPSSGHQLRELRNCIVFSKHGDRDLPSHLSGGDLDGDIYNIIWDPVLLYSGLKVFAAADYPRVPPMELDRAVKKEDMADFFVEFMKTDHLSLIAIRHMILADQRDEGTLHSDCNLLAQMHSSAVDFSKTGIPADLTKLPKANRARPDFLAPGPLTHVVGRSEIDLDEYIIRDVEDGDDDDSGPRYKYYTSEKVLGRLYRAVDEQKIWNEDIKRPARADGPLFWDQFLLAVQEQSGWIGLVDWTKQSEEAHRLRHAYEDGILSAMRDFSEHSNAPLTELEVFVGFTLNRTGGSMTRRQRDRSTQLRDEFERISTWITREMQGGPGGGRGGLHALELCLACVNVGCLTDGWARSRRYNTGKTTLESFRVVAAAALAREMRGWENGERTVLHAPIGTKQHAETGDVTAAMFGSLSLSTS